MRLSQYLAPTLREEPAEAEIPSHRLMLRAGLMRKVAAGIYTFLPLGTRAIQKVEQIVREEMNRAGALEVRLPIVQPAELWQETGRWEEYGPEMFRLSDRHGRLFALGPTHEEIVTDLVRGTVSSYRQLPLTLYQIQNKYRDEVRPRFGVMRSREFVMKDAYSFDRDEEGMHRSYRAMYEAYERVFRRCGLEFRVVEADSGAIGGSYTHEFMALAESGEAEVVWCPRCGYAADAEKAESAAPPAGEEPLRPLERVATPGVRTIQELVDFLPVDVGHTAKILFYVATYAGGREELVAAVLRGDRTLNEIKLKNALGALQVRMADQERVLRETGAPFGSAGPVGLRGARLLLDREVAAGRNWAVGANEEDWHLRNANPGRDFPAGPVHDLRLAGAGDPCPRCGEPMESRAGIEVGQVFELGTKYSERLGATFYDEEGRSRPILMGCYGIGVTRTVAAVIEQHHDESGIVWPVSVAPFEAVVVPVHYAEPAQREAAERLYRELQEAGVEVALDDRDERSGVKFNDADLVGYPYRVTVGPKALARGEVELTRRAGRQTESLPLEELADVLRRRLAADRAALSAE